MNVGEEESKARCDRVDMGMADGRLVASLLQLGGTYYTMCTRSQSECQNQTVIKE